MEYDAYDVLLKWAIYNCRYVWPKGGDGQNTDPQSMDYPNGLPKLTTLKWTTPKNTVSDEYYIKKLRFYTYTAQTCIFLFRMAFSRHVE